MQDENYKKLFSFPRMVQDLLRVLAARGWIEEVDFSTLGKLSAEYVSDDLRRRHGDTVWRVRFGHEWLHVLVLLEFQSRDERYMALRILEYTVLLYRELWRNEALGGGGLCPPVLPVVLYNGAAPWTAAREVRELISPVGELLSPYQPSQRYLVLDERRVEEDDLPGRNLMRAVVGLEQSRLPEDLLRVVDALQEWLPAPGDHELRRAFTEWVGRMMEKLAPGGTKFSPARTLEEIQMTLVERVSQWPVQWMEEGREQGLKQGLEQGREQGREEGLEHERALLCRQAASRFGADTSERLAAALAEIGDPDRLVDIGDWLVRCDTGQEFLSRVAPAAAGQERR